MIQIRNGLQWIFNKSRNDIQTIDNPNLKDQIKNYRELQSAVGPSNIHITVAYITNAEGIVVSDECEQERKTILDEYDNGVFASFKFELWSADEIVDQINAIEKTNKKIDANVKIKYDTNSPSLIKYQTEGLTGVVCSIPATEIARIVNEDKNGYIFDLNIRKYLGTRGSVNQEILSTCSDNESSFLFWFLNNGITIVCDKIDTVTDPDNPHIQLSNMQIVNGCQTASSIAKASREQSLKKDTRVLVRIYETGETDLVDKIVLTTNNQNKISGRNLRANDRRQIDLEEGFKLYNYYYERKQRQFDSLDDASKDLIISNEVAATAYLAIILKRCSDARSRKYKVWSEFYEKIFSGNIVEPYIVASLIHTGVKNSLKRDEYSKNKDEETRYLAKNASFHISRIASFLMRETDSWENMDQLKLDIQKLKQDKEYIDQITNDAFSILKKLISTEDKFGKDLNNTLKSFSLDSEISKYLHNDIQN